jgi:hypothetical protein
MTLYSIQLFKLGETYSKPIGKRLIPRHRAKRIVARLRRNGHDVYIAPVKITA